MKKHNKILNEKKEDIQSRLNEMIQEFGLKDVIEVDAIHFKTIETTAQRRRCIKWENKTVIDDDGEEMTILRCVKYVG